MSCIRSNDEVIKKLDEALKRNFNEEKIRLFNDELPRKFRNLKAGRLILEDDVSLYSLSRRTEKLGHIYIFEEGVVVLQQIRGFSKLVSRYLTLNNGMEYKLSAVYTMDNDLLLNTAVAYNSNNSEFFSFENDSTKSKFVFCFSSEDKKENMIAALRFLNSVRSFKSLTKHSFHPDTLEERDAPAPCQLCFKPLRGIYSQCYTCKTCSLNCHSYCMPAADLVECRKVQVSPLQKTWWRGEMSEWKAHCLIDCNNYENGLFQLRWSLKRGQIVITLCDTSSRIRDISVVTSGKGFTIEDQEMKTETSPFPSLNALVSHFNTFNLQTADKKVDGFLLNGSPKCEE